MLAPVVLPFQITVAIFAFVLVGIVLFTRRARAIAIALAAALLLFIPSCTAVMFVVDQYRYGRFDYAAAADIPDDGYIELPPTAKNVILFRGGGGHRARFDVGTEELKAWVTEMRSQRPELNTSTDPEEWTPRPPKNEPEKMLDELDANVFSTHFADTGWEYKPGMIEVDVTRSPRGGGYTIWHSAETGVTYLSAGYW